MSLPSMIPSTIAADGTSSTSIAASSLSSTTPTTLISSLSSSVSSMNGTNGMSGSDDVSVSNDTPSTITGGNLTPFYREYYATTAFYHAMNERTKSRPLFLTRNINATLPLPNRSSGGVGGGSGNHNRVSSRGYALPDDLKGLNDAVAASLSLSTTSLHRVPSPRHFSKELTITLNDIMVNKSSLRSLLSSVLSLTNIGSSKLLWQIHAQLLGGDMVISETITDLRTPMLISPTSTVMMMSGSYKLSFTCDFFDIQAHVLSPSWVTRPNTHDGIGGIRMDRLDATNDEHKSRQRLQIATRGEYSINLKIVPISTISRQRVPTFGEGQAIESNIVIGSHTRRPFLVSHHHRAPIKWNHHDEHVGDTKLEITWAYVPRPTAMIATTSKTPVTPIASSSSSTMNGHHDRVTNTRTNKVGFTYYYGPRVQQYKREIRNGYECVWCSIMVASLSRLICHLLCCHHHFHFTFTQTRSGIPMVNVRLSSSAHNINTLTTEPGRTSANRSFMVISGSLTRRALIRTFIVGDYKPVSPSSSTPSISSNMDHSTVVTFTEHDGPMSNGDHGTDGMDDKSLIDTLIFELNDDNYNSPRNDTPPTNNGQNNDTIDDITMDDNEHEHTHDASANCIDGTNDDPVDNDTNNDSSKTMAGYKDRTSDTHAAARLSIMSSRHWITPKEDDFNDIVNESLTNGTHLLSLPSSATTTGVNATLSSADATSSSSQVAIASRTRASNGARLSKRYRDRLLMAKNEWYHSTTFKPMELHELDHDSDDDVNEQWIVEQAEKSIDANENLAVSEKLMMKLWNQFVYRDPISSDASLSHRCRQFARLYAIRIIQLGLRLPFLLHLLSMTQWAVIDHECVAECMAIVGHIAGDARPSTAIPVAAASAPRMSPSTNMSFISSTSSRNRRPRDN